MVDVIGDADLPTLEVSNASGSEDSAIALDIDAGLTDSSETLTVTISGVPDGATLSAGTDNGDGTWTLLADSLDLSRQTENFEAIRMGRVFLSEYDGEGRMFEPVWQDRAQ